MSSTSEPTPAALARQLPLICVAGWLVPGLSHAMIGKRGKGLFLFALLLGTFLWGQHLGSWRIVDDRYQPMMVGGREYPSLSFFAQAGMALPFAVCWSIARQLPTADHPPTFESLGILYASIAALLNLLCVADAYERVVKANLPAASKKDEPAKGGEPKHKQDKA